VNGFLERHWNDLEVRADVARLEAAHPDDPAAVVAHVYWLMDQDKKSTGLKSLQGKIWEEGYRTGELRGEVYPDVAPALERWRRQGIDIAIFSSGSVQAQRSLFASTAAGDLTRSIRAYFDTTTGPKSAPDSYTRIAAALERSPSEVLFLSDIGAELDAARAAGMRTALCVRRPGSAPPAGAHPVIHTFDDLTAVRR
jgi:enolase-phosphatase E1